MTEWQPVDGYFGKYLVSYYGEIIKKNGKIIGQWENDQGYRLVRLSGPRAIFRVHRIVASAFIPNVNNLPFVNHIDCKRNNNVASNLEWCTHRQNLMHSHKLGRMKWDYWKGKRSHNAKLTDCCAEEIRKEYGFGEKSWNDLSIKYGISKRTVGRILNRESYV